MCHNANSAPFIDVLWWYNGVGQNWFHIVWMTTTPLQLSRVFGLYELLVQSCSNENISKKLGKQVQNSKQAFEHEWGKKGFNYFSLLPNWGQGFLPSIRAGFCLLSTLLVWYPWFIYIHPSCHTVLWTLANSKMTNPYSPWHLWNMVPNTLKTFPEYLAP